LTLPPGVGEGARARLEELARGLPRCVPGCLRSEVGRNLPGTLNGGDYTLDLVFEDAAAPRWLRRWVGSRGRRAWGRARRGRRVATSPGGRPRRAPRLRSRTLLLRVEPGRLPRVARFERELAAMPDHIPAIRNWHFARVCGPSGWSHVWTQEFETVDGLQADYLVHPYHWAVVDRWFDPESPERVVAPDFAHVFCAMPQSVLR
jgi:hypothetical protein